MSITPVDNDVIRTGATTVRLKRPQFSRAHTASEVVQWFLDYYWIRHPISDASIASYRTDLIALENWLAAIRNTTLLAASAKDLRAFLDDSYSSKARQPGASPSLSCIKRFYFYLLESGLRGDDPTERVFVRMPRPVEKRI